MNDRAQAESQHERYRVRGVHPARFDAIKKYAGESVLDIGCGNGSYVLQLRDTHDIQGCDIQPFESWEESPELFRVCDFTRDTVAEGSFETVTCFEVLEHLENPEQPIEQIHSICRKNAILTVPNCDLTDGMRRSLLAYYHYVDPTHVNFFTLDSFVNLCEGAGFKIREATYINRLDLTPFFEESFNANGILARLGRGLLRRTRTRDYYCTCLVVAEKG